ncbi:MAG: hypothetical protein F4X97_04215 [Boseongicola sp. SB0662_bin_57]|nr:hypothetical protein [Boseongicola sp. SB0662_bin_57]
MASPLSNPAFPTLFAEQAVPLAAVGLPTVALTLAACRIGGASVGKVLGLLLVLKLVTNVVFAPLAEVLLRSMPRKPVMVNTPSHKCDGFSAKPRANAPASRPKASSWVQCEKPSGSDHACQQGARIPLSPERDSPLREFGWRLTGWALCRARSGYQPWTSVWVSA